MKRRIHCLHFDHLPVDLTASWAGHDARATAIWPAPVNHDQCFNEAGFEDFEDPDERYDDELRQIASRLLDELLLHGEPRQVSKRYRRRRESLADELLFPVHDDQFEPCVIAFGDPPEVSVRTSDGHAIYWIIVHSGRAIDVEMLAGAIGDGRPVKRTRLDWEHLAS